MIKINDLVLSANGKTILIGRSPFCDSRTVPSSWTAFVHRSLTTPHCRMPYKLIPILTSTPREYGIWTDSHRFLPCCLQCLTNVYLTSILNYFCITVIKSIWICLIVWRIQIEIHSHSSCSISTFAFLPERLYFVYLCLQRILTIRIWLHGRCSLLSFNFLHCITHQIP